MTKETILAASREIAYQYGLQNLLMDELAKRCGISKKTIYEQFGSKEALIARLGQIFLEEEQEIFASSLKSAGSLQEKLQVVLDYLFKLSDLIPAEELTFIRKKHKPNHQMLLRYIEDIRGQLTTLLLEGQAQGVVHFFVNPDIQSRLLFAQVAYLHEHHRMLRQQGQVTLWREQLISSFFQAVLRQP